MSQLMGSILEGAIQYMFLGVIIALFIMVILLILLYERTHAMAFLKMKPLRKKFEQLCDLSDRLDEDYIDKNPYGSAMWLARLIWIGVAAAVGLMVIWVVVIKIAP